MAALDSFAGWGETEDGVFCDADKDIGVAVADGSRMLSAIVGFAGKGEDVCGGADAKVCTTLADGSWLMAAIDGIAGWGVAVADGSRMLSAIGGFAGKGEDVCGGADAKVRTAPTDGCDSLLMAAIIEAYAGDGIVA
jgi:hypothetical protein